jgi:hypothetical protein
VRFLVVFLFWTFFASALWAQGIRGETVVVKDKIKAADIYEVYPQGVIVVRSNQWVIRQGEIFFAIDPKNKVRGIIQVTKAGGELNEAKVLKGKVNLSYRLARVKSKRIIERIMKKKKPKRRDKQLFNKVETRATTRKGFIAVLGLNLSKIGGDAEISKNSSYSRGLNFGLGYGLSFNKVGFDFLLSYSQQGYKVEEDDIKSVSTAEYIILSGDVIYRIPVSNRGSLGLKLGYSYAHAIAEKGEVEFGETKLEFEAQPEDLEKIVDFQLRLGFVY